MRVVAFFATAAVPSSANPGDLNFHAFAAIIAANCEIHKTKSNSFFASSKLVFAISEIKAEISSRYEK